MYEHPADDPGAAREHLRRLEAARRRLRAEGRSVALLCAGASGRGALERAAPGRGAELTAWLLGLVEASLPSGEHVAALEGQDVVALLEASPAEAELAAARLVDAGRLVSLRAEEPPVWAGVHVGLAFDPPSRELFFETLVAVAQEGAAVARSRGGECVVHTCLYDLVQRRLERARGPLSVGAGVGSTGAAPGEAEAAREVAQPAVLGAARNGAPAGPETDLRPELASELDDERLLPLARSIAAENLELMRREIDARHREEISLLERRIARLVRSLEETEVELARLAELAGQDPGIPSIHRTLQGLSESEASYAKKRDLMAQLLEANLELRRRIAESAA